MNARRLLMAAAAVVFCVSVSSSGFADDAKQEPQAVFDRLIHAIVANDRDAFFRIFPPVTF